MEDSKISNPYEQISKSSFLLLDLKQTKSYFISTRFYHLVFSLNNFINKLWILTILICNI